MKYEDSKEKYFNKSCNIQKQLNYFAMKYILRGGTLFKYYFCIKKLLNTTSV